jgi:ubiquinone/menaquinone biosynthesis C-methylase UbiE
MTRAAKLWDSILGRRMSLRMENIILRRHRWNQEIYGEWLLRHVTKTTRWLDAGCGHRLLPPDFRDVECELLRKAGLVIGVDVSADSLRLHKTMILRTCASLERLPFADESFDLITCNMVVEHLPDPPSTFREFERVLSPGGALVVHTPNIWNYAVVVARVLKTVVPASVLQQLIRWSEERQNADIFPTFYRANSRASITSTLESFRLSCEQFEMLVGPQPICRFFAPIVLCELLLMRAIMWRLLSSFATTMLCSFRKGQSLESVSALAHSHSRECSILESEVLMKLSR